MSKLVKILLAILVVLLIAAGGFWSGTRFAYRQAAVTAAVAPAQGLSSPQDNSAQQDNAAPQADSNQQGSNGPRSYNNRDGSRQSDQNNRFGPGMMGLNNGRQWGNSNQNRSSTGNFGPIMPGFNNGTVPGGMMAIRQHNGGFMGGAFMLFGLLFSLGFGILMVLGIIILFRIVRHTPPAPTAASTPCTKCGASLQAGWSHCPHCGEPIQK
jgi:hypothetical protein